MNDFQELQSFAAGESELMVEPKQRFGDRWLVRFEVNGLDENLDLVPSLRIAFAPYFRFLPRAIASLASLSAVRRRSVSRLSQSCFPLARASSTFTRPFLK